MPTPNPEPTRITSPDDLLRLAPDAKSLEAGRRLFYSRRWRLVGGDGQWLWGEFVFGTNPQGKASQTAVELTTGRFYCNCRGRQRPCAHGLALVLMLKNAQEKITVSQPPSWVRSVQFQAEKSSKPVSNVLASEDRMDERLALMSSGVEELEIRLLDVARRGIADTVAQGPAPFLNMATRLKDAKLGGPAGRLRRLANLIGAADGARDEAAVARILGDLYLFVRTWQNRSALPAAQHDELLQYAGVTTRKDDLLARPGLEDHWLVLGVVFGQEDKLRFRRVWLRGENSRRFALLVDYAFGERAFERSWPLAASFTGSIHYYPGSYPQRAVFPYPVPGGKPYDGLTGYATIAGLRANYQKALAFNPWLPTYPAYFPAVRPVRQKGKSYLVDERGEALALAEGYENFFTLLAISGGEPMSVFGEFDGYRFLPLGVVGNGGLVQA